MMMNFDLINSFPALLLDAYGVFWGGNGVGPLPGSIELMRQLVAQGKIIGILSNTTQLSLKEKEKFSKHQILENQHYHFIVTSGELARTIFLNNHLPFATPQKKYLLFCETDSKYPLPYDLFGGSPFRETKSPDEADFIYINVPLMRGEDQIDPSVFVKQIQELKKSGLPMVCANPDHFAHEGKPARLVVRQGSIAAIYEEMGGNVFYIGKPHLHAYQEAMRHFEFHNILERKKVLMIGDTPETDIRGAKNFGFFSALVTETGIMGERQTPSCKLSPEETPNYFMKRFSHDI
jgi:HAD superfamily hydrolase (TIGR01459 family)